MLSPELQDQLMEPACANQALHLAEICVVALESFDFVMERTHDSFLIRGAEVVSEVVEDLTAAAMRMLTIALHGDAETAAVALAEAMMTTRTLHEILPKYLPDPRLQN